MAWQGGLLEWGVWQSAFLWPGERGFILRLAFFAMMLQYEYVSDVENTERFFLVCFIRDGRL